MLGQVWVLIGAHRIDGREHHLFGFFVARNRFGRLAFQVGERIADLHILDTLNSRHNVSHLTHTELALRIELQLVVSELIDFVVPS